MALYIFRVIQVDVWKRNPPDTIDSSWPMMSLGSVLDGWVFLISRFLGIWPFSNYGAYETHLVYRFYLSLAVNSGIYLWHQSYLLLPMLVRLDYYKSYIASYVLSALFDFISILNYLNSRHYYPQTQELFDFSSASSYTFQGVQKLLAKFYCRCLVLSNAHLLRSVLFRSVLLEQT